MTAPSTADEWVVLGRVAGLYGVQGWIKLVSYTRRREDIFNYPRWRLKRAGEWHAFTLLEGRAQGKGLAAHLEGLNDRDQASQWIGADIAISKAELPALAPGTYYWSQLEGLKVVNMDGIEFGRVDHLFDTGANDVLVVTGDRERLIPYTRDTVRAVDLAAGVIRVDWDADF
ncbi:MAG: 16S rRNA processing protein RimM [Candidatus Muproteobacteria bacterium RBG_16_64_11]|uniref:Ribosome maturation factor RimM n=1 Tax=Candidatus Muproteobacteria bacterium RBG_16_64_11 TaxID=1817758 RepID=A0A1F6TB07_9PROT|nr:MAG: 16S rRNA processing protein RimM [Candidatus Muproteobacteria bacterium RBG_16_64_11]